MNHETVRETWTKRVERWRQSGLSYAAFAREHGLNQKSLRWWRIRLDNEAQGATSPATATAAPLRPRAGTRRVTSNGSPLTFIEVSPKPAAAPIEIVVGASVVRVAPGFDATTLGRVHDVLKGRA